MIKKIFTGLMLCSLGLTTSCESSSTGYNTPYCETGEGKICEPPGFAFVNLVNVRSDACPDSVFDSCPKPVSTTTVSLSQPENGKLCMKGTVAGKDGFAWLVLGVSHWNQAGTQIFDLLNASALGIKELQLNVDTPPTGMHLFATTAHQTRCDNGPPGCLDGWDLMTAPRSNLVKPIETSGLLKAPFADFANIDPNKVFDTSKLGSFIFVMSPGAFDFCVSGLKFLDAQGNEVTPPPTVDAGSPQG